MRERAAELVTVLSSIVLFGAGIGASLAGELQRYEPRPIAVSDTFDYDAEAVELEQARRIAEHFLRRFGEQEHPVIYGIPENPDLFLVSGSADHRGERDFGGRFYLIRDAGDGPRELFRGRGAGDSYILRPTFFHGAGRLLILAEVGAEYTWGLDAYALEGDTLIALGSIDAALWTGEALVNPLLQAQVSIDGSTFRLEFFSDLVLGPGTYREWELPRSGAAIRFARDGERFVLVDDADQVCFFSLEEEPGEAAADLRYYYGQLGPWFENRRLAHSFQTELPLGMIAAGPNEVRIEADELGTDVGVVLRSRDGRTKIVPGVYTDVDLAEAIGAFFGDGGAVDDAKER